MLENLSNLFQLYVRPSRAMSGILDHGSWIFGVVAAILLSFLLSFSQPFAMSFENVHPRARAMQPQVEDPEGAAAPITRLRPSPAVRFISVAESTGTVVMIFCIFVPLSIALIAAFESLGSFTTVLFRDYAPLLACCSFAWLAARIPVGVVEAFLPPSSEGHAAVLAVGLVYFLVLMLFALQVLFGAGVGTAGAALVLAAGGTGALLYFNILGFVIPYLASPFLLFYGYRYFSGDLQNLGQGLRSRQAFRRHLEASTLNPRDADAHVQLGLIYQARRQYEQAAERYRKALAIDPNEPEAHFQLGKIDREQGRLDAALVHFQTVAKIDAKFSSYEVWREAGATYLALKRYSDALPVLKHFCDHRSFDAEGLYYYGEALEGSGDIPQAREMWERCVEAMQTAPGHRRRFVNRWGRLAQKKLRTKAST